MLTLYRALVLPLLEYCCQLWSPNRLGLIRELEQVQRNFTSRIAGLSDLDYWQRLQNLGLYSLERRRERYIIIYVWKILNGLVPNIGGGASIVPLDSTRRGRLCAVPPILNAGIPRHKTLRENSLAVIGPQLFNCIPADVRGHRGTADCFKAKLDRYLSQVPDKPCMINYRAGVSNCIIKQEEHRRASRAADAV